MYNPELNNPSWTGIPTFSSPVFTAVVQGVDFLSFPYSSVFISFTYIHEIFFFSKKKKKKK